MGAATLSEIFTYPIKSTVASRASGAPLGPRGLRYDRHWAIFGETGDLLTARDHPDLLRVVTEAGKESLSVRIDGEEVVSMSYASSGRQRKEVDVWGVSGTGSPVKPAINDWFSSFLGVKCEVLFMDEDSNRPVHADYGGAPGDVVSYADECPVMILSEATVIDLNGKLEVPVPVTQFRPNLVIANVEAAAEDGWKRIRVGECELEVTKQCKRCVSATINPESRTVPAR